MLQELKNRRRHMTNKKRILNVSALALGLSLLFMGASCKTASTQSKVPFSIDEKTYFHWVGKSEAKRGTTITIKGFTQTLNLSFSKIYFQNHEYDVVPQFNGTDFVLSATRSELFPADLIMSGDPLEEYGNKPPSASKSKIPFDLKNDEAVLQYSVNGQEAFHKVSGIRKMETVFKS